MNAKYILLFIVILSIIIFSLYEINTNNKISPIMGIFLESVADKSNSCEVSDGVISVRSLASSDGNE